MAIRNSKEIKKRSKAKGDDGERLYVRGRTDHRDSREINANVEKKTVLCRFDTKDWDISQVLKKQRLFGKKSLGRHSTQGVIDYVHSDLWGPSQVESLGGKRYFLCIVDDYSRREFEQLCIEIGIARHLTVAKMPQQNRLAEHANKTPIDNGVKGYRLYRLDDKSPKIVTIMNVIFNESVMYKDTLKDSGACDKSVEELQVEVELQRIDNEKLVKMPLGGHFKLSLKECPVRDCDFKRMSKEAVKWILKYFRRTANVGLVYGTNCGNHIDVISFVDSDYSKDPNKGRSMTGYAFLIQGCVVSWKAMLQHVVALSTTKAEYIAFTDAVKEAIWLRGLLEELGIELNTVAANCDNQRAIHLSWKHVFHERTKHINVRYHFIREVLEAKTVKVLKVDTEHNVADALTKMKPELKLQHWLELLNVDIG
nr:retrovirus-related Pol polyprotein from transposon TNT 1-94 [Tanacetum cinerariifolium]